MKQKRFRTAVIGLIVAANCFVISPSSLFALIISPTSVTRDLPEVKIIVDAPEGRNENLNPEEGARVRVLHDGIPVSTSYGDPSKIAELTSLDKTIAGLKGRETLPEYSCSRIGFAVWCFGRDYIQRLRAAERPPSPAIVPFSMSFPERGEKRLTRQNFSPDLARLEDSEKLYNVKFDSLITEILEFMKVYKEAMRKYFSLDDQEAEQLTDELDQQWKEKIDALILQFQNQDGVPQSKESEVVVLDTIDFTQQMKAIHRLLNPPARLHPWLKWLLYLNRVTPEMLQFYQAALEGRDRIFTLAMKSNGKLKIRYQGSIMSFPLFPFPDEAEGAYELVLVRDRAPVGSNSALPAASAQVVQ